MKINILGKVVDINLSDEGDCYSPSLLMNKKEVTVFGDCQIIISLPKSLPINRRRFRVEKIKSNNHRVSKTEYEAGVNNFMTAPFRQKNLIRNIVRVSKLVSHTASEWPNNHEGTTPLALIGAQIGAVRRRQGLTVEDLAAKANVDSDTLLAIELGVASLEDVSQNLRALGEALNINYEKITKLFARFVFDE